MLDYLPELDRLGIPSDQAASLEEQIAANRTLRILGGLSEPNRAARALRVLRIVLGNVMARSEYPPTLSRGDILRAFHRGVAADLPILDREIERESRS
jgi:hypothetical protein